MKYVTLYSSPLRSQQIRFTCIRVKGQGHFIYRMKWNKLHGPIPQSLLQYQKTTQHHCWKVAQESSHYQECLFLIGYPTFIYSTGGCARVEDRGCATIWDSVHQPPSYLVAGKYKSLWQEIRKSTIDANQM